MNVNDTATIPNDWRQLLPGEYPTRGDRYDSGIFWFPVEIMTPEDYKRKDIRFIRYQKKTS